MYFLARVIMYVFSQKGHKENAKHPVELQITLYTATKIDQRSLWQTQTSPAPDTNASLPTWPLTCCWWNTVIRSEKLHFMYLSTESTILPPGTKTFNIKGGIFFLESKTEDTELQDSVAASEVSSWIS